MSNQSSAELDRQGKDNKKAGLALALERAQQSLKQVQEDRAKSGRGEVKGTAEVQLEQQVADLEAQLAKD